VLILTFVIVFTTVVHADQLTMFCSPLVAGEISLALLLGPNTAAVYLGKKEIETSLPGNFSIKTAPVFETLRARSGNRADFGKFDEITAMSLLDLEH
jgi:hypothetical protein